MPDKNGVILPFFDGNGVFVTGKMLEWLAERYKKHCAI
jgi:hypothetical protein